MELKKYQKDVVSDLKNYLKLLNETGNYIDAYDKLWESKNILTNGIGPRSIAPYCDIIGNCASVCLKVPTAGGKTFLACNAIETIVNHVQQPYGKVVLWLVPSSDTILNQTIKNLSNVNHPYRKKIDTAFDSKVEIYTIEQLLQGESFKNYTSIQDQLSIFVMSFDAFRINDKESRRVYRENGNLAGFNMGNISNVEGADPSSFANVLYSLNPIIIIDESHKAGSSLSIETMKVFNPSFILQITATPSKESNIISIATAIELKREHMVKLPVIAYNTQSKAEVIESAVHLQHRLEEIAIENKKQGGQYIRPIVLFQAQPQNQGDNDTEEDIRTYNKIKQILVDGGIDSKEIAIQTANIKELNNIDLLSEDCEIRYIITINALKEGRDCPFAYILASLANKSSETDVTQILGRILRQPYAQDHKNEMLNISYVLTSSNEFNQTLNSIIEGLGQAGFSSRNSRIDLENLNEDELAEELIDEGVVEVNNKNINSKEYEDGDNLDEVNLKNLNVLEYKPEQYKLIEKKAIEGNQVFMNKINNKVHLENSFGTEYLGKYSMMEIYENTAKAIALPKFFIKDREGLNNQNLFGINNILSKGDLLAGFNLKRMPINISLFEDTSNIQMIDAIENRGDTVIRPGTLKASQKEMIQNYLKGLSEEKQKETVTDILKDKIGKFDSISEKDLRDYIGKIVGDLDPASVQEIGSFPFKYASKISSSIQLFQMDYAIKKLEDLIDTNKVVTNPTRLFPETISPKKAMDMGKMLYEKEEEVTGFEERMISRIINLENVEWRHRNTRNNEGFYINGPINHYPDFILYTKKGNILLVETKGKQLKNPDSELKIKLGKLWSNLSGTNFHYFMVFEEDPMDGGKSLDEFLGILKEL